MSAQARLELYAVVIFGVLLLASLLQGRSLMEILTDGAPFVVVFRVRERVPPTEGQGADDQHQGGRK